MCYMNINVYRYCDGSVPHIYWLQTAIASSLSSHSSLPVSANLDLAKSDRVKP